jgi:hypothetical protein
MTSLDSLTVIIAVAVSCVVALLGWPLGSRERRQGRAEIRQSKRRLDVTRTVIAICAAVAAVLAPELAVLWGVVALNLTLGRRENVPFSTYAMFSRPERTAWALRFEDCDGRLVPIGTLGLAPHTMRKRFTTELRAARQQGIRDVDAARRRAAAPLAALVEQHRPPAGPLATSGITIVLVEYSMASEGLVTVETPIVETSPQ